MRALSCAVRTHEVCVHVCVCRVRLATLRVGSAAVQKKAMTCACACVLHKAERAEGAHPGTRAGVGDSVGAPISCCFATQSVPDRPHTL